MEKNFEKNLGLLIYVLLSIGLFTCFFYSFDPAGSGGFPTDFYNKLTKKNDPINAPEWKWNSNIKWGSPIGEIGLNYRHVNQFIWNDGIWSGIIGPYDIFDFYYNYLITKNLKFSLAALNFMNNEHKELIGGAKMGKQVIIRLTSNF